MRTEWRCVAFAAAFVTASTRFAFADELDSLKAQLADARADIHSHAGQWYPEPDGSQAAQDAVAHAWSLIEEIAAAELDAGKDVAKEKIADGVDIAATPLTPDAWLVSADVDNLGTVFVVQQAYDGFHSAWNIRALSAPQLASFPPLATWSVGAATETCKESCGPMRAEMGSLGADDSGRPLFYLNAYYTAQQGNDVGYQLSVWAWDGAKAVPQFAQVYMQTLDVSIALEFKAPFLRFHVKDAFKTFYVTAPEAGRQMVWTLLLTGDGVRDLGKRSVEPELDAVDDLFARILRHKPTSEIASSKAAAVVGDAFRSADVSVSGSTLEDIYGAAGELQISDVVRRQHDTILCFSSDNLMNYAFTLRPQGDGYFVSRVRKVRDDEKAPCKYWKP